MCVATRKLGRQTRSKYRLVGRLVDAWELDTFYNRLLSFLSQDYRLYCLNINGKHILFNLLIVALPLSLLSFLLLFSTGTFHLPMWQRDADAEHRECHIDGAVRFDFRVIRHSSHQMPLMLPPAAQFEKQVGEVMMT